MNMLFILIGCILWNDIYFRYSECFLTLELFYYGKCGGGKAIELLYNEPVFLGVILNCRCMVQCNYTCVCIPHVMLSFTLPAFILNNQGNLRGE